MRHYCGPIFLPQVANAICNYEPRSGVQMGQATSTLLHGTILHTSEGNCSDLRGSGDYSASCGGTTKHGISTANRFRTLKREQLPART